MTNNRSSSLLCNKKLAAILNTIYLDAPYNLVISHEKKDELKADELQAHLKFCSYKVFACSFDAFMVLSNLVDVFLIGDGGIMHLAAGLGKKQLCLFARTSIQQWRPLSNYATILYDESGVNNICNKKIVASMLNLLKEKQAR